MGRPKSTVPPKYSQAKGNQARAYINRKEYPLGAYGSPESYERYNQLLDYWRRGIEPPKQSELKSEVSAPTASAAYTGGMTINELMIQYLDHCNRYYRKNGERTSEYATITYALNVVCEQWGDFPVADFDAGKLSAVKESMITTRDWARKHLNNQLSRVKAMFKWAVANGYAKPEQHALLSLVPGVAKGRDERVREGEKITTVDDVHVDAIREYVPRQVWAMIELQRFGGLRPGEAVIIRKGDVRQDKKLDAWVYYPESVKTEHHEGCRKDIVLGPQSAEIVQEWEKGKAVGEYLFSPKDAFNEYLQAKRKRFNPKNYYPSEIQRRKVRAMNQARGVEAELSKMHDHFTVDSYRRAITRAIERCNRDRRKEAGKEGTLAVLVENWCPNQLRHNTATKVREQFGLDGAQAVTRHKNARTTEVYAEVQRKKHAEIMRQVG